MELIDLSKEKVFIFNSYPQFYDFLITNDKRYYLSMVSNNIILSDITLNELVISLSLNTKPSATWLGEASSKYVLYLKLSVYFNKFSTITSILSPVLKSNLSFLIYT